MMTPTRVRPRTVDELEPRFSRRASRSADAQLRLVRRNAMTELDTIGNEMRQLFVELGCTLLASRSDGSTSTPMPDGLRRRLAIKRVVAAAAAVAVGLVGIIGSTHLRYSY